MQSEKRRWRGASLVALLMMVVALVPVATLVPTAAAAAAAPAVASPHFQSTWAYTDQPVASGAVNRTWMWGPSPDSPALVEPYWDSSAGWRLVQYFDKTRMEITHPNGNQSSIWYVTNGLLAKELITGNMQLGDNLFVQYLPAQVNVAGDLNDPNGPTYASFNGLMGYAPIPSGWTITQTVNRAGQVGNDASLASYHVSAQDVGAPTKHDVASVFWAFMNSTGLVEQNGQTTTGNLFQNPFYATGYPLTEAYWTNVLVGGVSKQVLVQVFERRVLTYTPSNPSGWQVESGNVGLQYYQWRYQQLGQTPQTQLGLASAHPSVRSCGPAQYTAGSNAVSQLYGETVTLDLQGTVCAVFHPEYDEWWDLQSGTATIYNGTQATGTPIGARPFNLYLVSQDPTNYVGFPPPGFVARQCGAQQFYQYNTVVGEVQNFIHYTNGVWDESGTIFTNPQKTYDFPTPCLQPPCTAGTGLGTPGDLHIYFDARLEPNSIPGDPQGQVPYLFVVSGTDLSTVNLSQVIQGPAGSTPIYHGGNCVFLYLSPSTPTGQQSVTIKLSGGRQASTTFTYLPTIGSPPAAGSVVNSDDTTTPLQMNAAGAAHSRSYPNTLGDASLSVDVRLDTPGGSGFACLTSHAADPFWTDQIDFCLLSSGETVVNREVQGTQETILGRAQRQGTHPVTDWNTLTVVSQGNVLWFFVNGTLVGSAQHSMGTSAGVGYWAQSSGDAAITWEFKDIVLKSLQ